MPQKPSILIITFCIPWPVADGGKMYVYTSVNYLRKYYNITLLVSVYNAADMAHVATIQGLWPDVTIEIVNYIKQLSTKQKLKKHIRNFYFSNFSKAGAAQSHVFFNLRKKITNIFLLSPDFLSKCEQLLAQHSYDIVQVEYSTNIAAINFIPANAIKIYVEIESLHAIMQDFLRVGSDNSFANKYLVTSAKHIEIDFMRRYGAIFALNMTDHKRMADLLPGQHVFTSPYAVPDAWFSTPEALKKWEPQKLIFIGSENHYPNKDAIEWYVAEILPLLKNISIQLYITGTWSNDFKASLSNIKNIIFTGFANDLSALMQNSIMVVPIRLGGGGIRAKVLQAMAAGTPVVTTSLGSAGIVPDDDTTMLIRDEAAGFANAIEKLAANNQLALSLIGAAYDIAQKSYSEKAAGSLRHSYYQQLLQTAKNDN